MFWHEDKNPDEVQIPDDIVDLLFTIDCKSIPSITRICYQPHCKLRCRG
ncbi:hypothetical protein [Chromatium okenii]|nr:hypothetical protein [Chromatium okenii]